MTRLAGRRAPLVPKRPSLLPACAVIVAAGLFVAWVLTGWYGAGILLLTWVLLGLIAAMALQMAHHDAERLAMETEGLYTCHRCLREYRYGSELWVDHVPHCRPCAREAMGIKEAV